MTYFEPPKVIRTEVFAEVPEKYRKNDNVRAGKKRSTFLEGPSFDRDGNLYVVDIPNGRIFRISPSGDFTVAAEYDGDPNGLKIHKDGRIFLADHRNGLMLMDPASGSVTSYLEGPDHLERFKGLNDLVFASNGDLYFTDQGQTGLHDPTGRVFRLSADGKLQCLLDTIPSPNGLVLSRSERAVFVAVTPGECDLARPDDGARRGQQGGSVRSTALPRPGWNGARRRRQPGRRASGGSASSGFSATRDSLCTRWNPAPAT